MQKSTTTKFTALGIVYLYVYTASRFMHSPHTVSFHSCSVCFKTADDVGRNIRKLDNLEL